MQLPDVGCFILLSDVYIVNPYLDKAMWVHKEYLKLQSIIQSSLMFVRLSVLLSVCPSVRPLRTR